MIALSETFETQHTRFQQAVLNAQSAASAKHQQQQAANADASTASGAPTAPAVPTSQVEPELRDSEWLAYQAALDDWLERLGALRAMVGNPLAEKDQKPGLEVTPYALLP